MGCANRHVEKETLIKVYLMVWNALVENRADFMEQWTEQLQSENLLEGYRAEKFIEYTDGAEPLTQMDTDFMLKTLAAQIKQYKKSTILTPIFAALEVVMEVLIPMAMARLVKYGIEGGDTGAIYRYGFLMMAMAMLSLVFGSVCAHTASHASTGFAANLRDGMYRNIQRFSFANIDKYSTAGLVTRMTTDVTNVQNAFQMITRIAVRSPLTLIFSMIVAFVINPELAGVFLIPLVLLGVVLGLIIKRATHLFDQVFKKYDDLNASVQENVSGIRVVKAFVREDFEDKKFGKAATNVYNLFVKAERIIAFNSPVMMLTIYGSVMALSWLGASLVTGGSLDVGDLTAMFTYVMNMLMNLMMLSMIFVMLTMSAASARRIVEVLNEEPSLSNPEQPLETVKDGSIDFNHVMFKYHADGNGDPILNDVDLHIKSGETVGIIGGTGRAQVRHGSPAQSGCCGAAEERAVLRLDSGKPALGQ